MAPRPLRPPQISPLVQQRMTVGLGTLALKSLDPRYPEQTQLWVNCSDFLRQLVAELETQLAYQGADPPESAELANLGARIARTFARQNQVLGTKLSGGQPSILNWVKEQIEAILAANASTQDAEFGFAPDILRLQTLFELLNDVNTQLEAER